MREIATVLETVSLISSVQALDEILGEVAEKTAQLLGADGCAISEWDVTHDALVVLADHVSPQARSPFDNSGDTGAVYPLAHYPATVRVLSERTPLIVTIGNPTADEAERELLQALQWDGVLMVPMLSKGKAVGLMEVYLKGSSRRQFTPDDVMLCQTLANQAAAAIENARLYRAAEDGRLHAEAIQVIGRALASELDYQRIVRNVAEFAYRLVGAQFILVAVPENASFRLVAVAGRDENFIFATGFTDFPSTLLTREPLDRAVKEKSPVVVANVRRDPMFPASNAEALIQGVQAMVAVPLLSHDRVVGVLAAYAHQQDFFDADSVATLMALASQAAVAIQNAQLFGELEEQREALRQVSLRLVNAQEEERRRISRELHDELGQALTALKINLDVARRALAADVSPKLQRSISEATSLVVQALETTRSLSLELRPAMLDDLGLVSALRWEIDRYEQRTSQKVDFEADLAGQTLRSELEITLYRIISEALTNVARHAHARHIRVTLQVENRHLSAGVEDDGVGFDAAAWFASPAGRQSLGLVSMRERATLLGGQFQVVSQPGHGTHVRVSMPIED